MRGARRAGTLAPRRCSVGFYGDQLLPRLQGKVMDRGMTGELYEIDGDVVVV